MAFGTLSSPCCLSALGAKMANLEGVFSNHNFTGGCKFKSTSSLSHRSSHQTLALQRCNWLETMFWLKTGFGKFLVISDPRQALQEQASSRVPVVCPSIALPNFAPQLLNTGLNFKEISHMTQVNNAFSKDSQPVIPCLDKLRENRQEESLQTKRKHRSLSTETITEGVELAKKIKPSERVKGRIYEVRGERKRWDGHRFSRCCLQTTCKKLAQGGTQFCKRHGGGARCRVRKCKTAAREGTTLCARHRRFFEELREAIRSQHRKD